MKRAVGYVRVSTDQQAQSGLSLDAQRAKVAVMAQVDDYVLTEIIVDAGVSAKNLARPGWKRIENMIANKAIDAVLVTKLDRVTRSLVDLNLLVQRCVKKGVALVSNAEKVDTASASGKLILNLLGAISEWERDVIAERTSAALQQLKAQGKRTGGRAPFGMRYTADGLCVEDEQEQALIGRVKAMRADGLSWGKVAAELNGSGSVTRTGRPWSRQGLMQNMAAAA